MSEQFSFKKIATATSCYKEKFGTPRQSGLASSSTAVIEFVDEYNNEDYFRELKSFSHLWLVFIFHQHLNKKVSATVRPPRLGGNKRIGVFASRSTYRPNPIGLSVVKLDRITRDNKKMCVHVSGVDLIDGTPVLDIKPYLHYSDSIPDANSGYATNKPCTDMHVSFSEQSLSRLTQLSHELPELKSLLIETLSLDPRPAYINEDNKVYGMKIYDYNICWKVKSADIFVVSIEDALSE